MFKSGFVNIVGQPNVGKSTLINALIGDQLVITSHKPQTTRHRTLAIVNTDSYQMIFSDTPGYIHNPNYKLQEMMNQYVSSAFEDADIAILAVGPKERFKEDSYVLTHFQKIACPKILVINKTDLLDQAEILSLLDHWHKSVQVDQYFPVSALQQHNVKALFDCILTYLPEGPKYFPEGQLSDRSERFFVTEIIRESILELFQEEIPYSTQVEVEKFKESDEIIRIHAMIYVNRKTQKSILIGKQGSAIKKLGIKSRIKLESFFKKQIFLDLYVKVRSNWRDDDLQLKRFGYNR